MERETHRAALSADASANHDDSPATGASSTEPPPAPAYEEVNTNKNNSMTEVTEPSASEEQLQEAVSEQKGLSHVHQLT